MVQRWAGHCILTNTNQIKNIMKILLILTIIVSLSSCENEKLLPKKYIAHAGGGVNNIRYCNCFEALNKNYELGHRFFEIDFSWTKDKQLVAIHDWGQTYKRFYGNKIPPPPTYEMFKSLKMKGGYSSITLTKLSNWLKLHDDAYIVTDVKNNNIAALTYIRDNFPKDISKYIPQIYFLNEYEPVYKLG